MILEIEQAHTLGVVHQRAATRFAKLEKPLAATAIAVCQESNQSAVFSANRVFGIELRESIKPLE